MATKKPKTRTNRVLEMAEHLGVSLQSIRNWMREPDWPGAGDGSVSLDDLSVWRYRRDVGEQLAAGDDFTGSDSPNLERMRKARADIWELELDAKRGNFLPRDDVHQLLGELASVLRGAGERLQKQCGLDARDIMEEGLQEFLRRMEERLGDDRSDGDHVSSGANEPGAS